MVSSITSLTGNGLKDWLIQRVSAVYFAVYSLFLFFYLFFHLPLQFEQCQRQSSSSALPKAAVIPP